MSNIAISTASAPAKPPAADWTGTVGERWANNVEHFEMMLHDVGMALLAHANFVPGERVVEIGCGGGGLSRLVAAAVAPAGTVLGLDISPVLVALASDHARTEQVGNVSFLSGDAQTTQPPGVPFDRLLSRFGVMFFADPAAAMVNLHGMLKPGGRLDFAVWAPIDSNPWAAVMMQMGQAHLALPSPPPGAPGPFAFGDADYLRSLLDQGGFQAISFKDWVGKVKFGGPGSTAEQTAEMAMITGALADAISDADESVGAAIKSDLTDFFGRYVTQAGVLVPASVHLVSAMA